MHSAVTFHGIEDAVREFEQNPDSANELNEQGLPPLYTAALYRNREAIDFLLQNGAACDIFACCYLGRASDADRLLREDPQLVHQTTKNGMTPLHYAARCGYLDIAQLLVEGGADVNARDSDGGTPLLEACHAGPWKSQPAVDVVELLLDHDATIDLHTAAAMGQIDLVERLLSEDFTIIDNLNEKGETSLYLAAKNNRLDVVRLLVTRGADVNLSDAVGTAALHRTSQECSDELIRFLIANGADAHLCCYVACGDEGGTRKALVARPDSASEIFYEYNAVGYAIHSWQLGALRILLEHGCKLSDEEQQHILRISNGDRSLVDELLALSRGAGL